MRKKVTAIIIFMCFFVMLSGCDDERDEQTPAGQWQYVFFANDVYTFHEQDLRFLLPNGWRSFTNDQLITQQRFLNRGFFSVPRLSPTGLASLGAFETDMFAMNMASRISAPTEAGSVQIMTGQLHDHLKSPTARDAMGMMFRRGMYERRPYTPLDVLHILQTELNLVGITHFEIDPEPVLIGGDYFYMMDLYVEAASHFPLNRRIYLNVSTGGTVKIIVVTDLNAPRIDAIMTYFLNADAKLIPPLGRYSRVNEVTEASDLLGNWIWTGDGCTILTFDADFTGRQAFCDTTVWNFGVYQYFEWWFYEGVLYLNVQPEGMAVFTQIWQTSLRTDMLNLLSFYSPGVYYRAYVREDSDHQFIFEARRQDILGSWAWDSNDDFKYVFNEDGTGIRGFSTSLHDFTWTFDAGVLSLFFEATNHTENWQVGRMEGQLRFINVHHTDQVFYYFARE